MSWLCEKCNWLCDDTDGKCPKCVAPDNAMGFSEWLNTEADLEEMDGDILAMAAWNAAIKQARRQIVNEILACGLEIGRNHSKYNCDFEPLSTEEVMAILEEK